MKQNRPLTAKVEELASSLELVELVGIGNSRSPVWKAFESDPFKIRKVCWTS